MESHSLHPFVLVPGFQTIVCPHCTRSFSVERREVGGLLVAGLVLVHAGRQRLVVVLAVEADGVGVVVATARLRLVHERVAEPPPVTHRVEEGRARLVGNRGPARRLAQVQAEEEARPIAVRGGEVGRGIFAT